MSHIVTIDLQIKDLDALAKAAEDNGMELVRGQETFKWYGKWVGDYPLPEGFTREDLGKCQHAIRVKGAGPQTYEIGVAPRRDGKPGWVCLYDFWAGGHGLEAKAGAGLKNILQRYTAHVTRRELVRQGFRVQERVLPNGKLQMTFTR
jgi:hypothetical protein